MSESSVALLEAVDLDRIRAPLQRAWTLPPAAYTNPEVFQKEQSSIFAKGWVCVAREDQLTNIGDYSCMDVCGQPIMVVRGRDNVVRAFSRVCLHRAMPIAEGQGNATRFVCPYHNWTYELDGCLRSAPMMQGVEEFDAASERLPELRVEIWQGFVFITLDPEATPLTQQIEGLSPLVEKYAFDQMVCVGEIEFDSPWNWKILVENFMEAYHHIGTHKTTFEPDYPARDSLIEENNGEPWVFLRMPGKEDELVAVCVYPTLLFAASSAGGAWYQLEPFGHDQMRLRIHALAPHEVANQMDDESREHLMETLRVVHREDIEANEGPWRGLQGGLTRQGRLSMFEKSIWQLNQLWLDRIKLA